MKFLSLGAALLMAFSSTVALVETIRDEDGTVVETRWVQDYRVSALSKRSYCTHNSCLGEMIARPDLASSFCQGQKTAPSMDSGPFTQCSGPSQVASACSCVAPTPTPPACIPSNGHCNLGSPESCCGKICVNGDAGGYCF